MEAWESETFRKFKSFFTIQTVQIYEKIIALFVFVFTLSCQPNEELTMKTSNDYNQIIEDYNSVFVEAFEKTTRVNMVSTIGISESSRVLRLNRKLIQTTAAEFLGSKGVPIVQLNRPNDAVAILQSGVIQNPTVILNSVNHMIDTTKVFSSEHRKFMKRFIADMSNLQENGDGNQIIDLFNKEIIKSELLNEGEKIQLLLFGSQSYALLKFYNR